MSLLTQYASFYISPFGEKSVTDELNTFLRSHRIINVEKKLIDGERGTGWVFLVEYGGGEGGKNSAPNASQRVDYREVLKPPVFGNSVSGLPFLGFLIKGKGIYLMRKSKRRVTGRMLEITASLYQGSITEEKAAERVRSVFAAIDLARTNRFRKRVCEKGERSLALTV